MSNRPYIYHVRQPGGFIKFVSAGKGRTLEWCRETVKIHDQKAWDIVRIRDGGTEFERVGTVWDVLRTE